MFLLRGALRCVLSAAAAMLFLQVSAIAAICPSPAINAFTGCYFANTTLSGDPAFIRTDSALNFYWGNDSPDKSLPRLNFSVRWQGKFTFDPGIYTFTAITSDGMRLYIDGNLILDRWRDQAPFIYTRQYTMTGGSHLLVIEYYDETGGATADLSWLNTSPTPNVPVISSFTALPSTVTSGQPVTFSWSVTGGTSISIDNGIGDVTARSSVTAFPVHSATYTLTASNTFGATTATASVTVSSATDVQPPSVPTLVSATAVSGTEVDLVWKASTDNIGVAGYQIFRNGAVVASAAGPALTWADLTAKPGTTYLYALKAYDSAGNYSNTGNSVQVTTPASTLGTCPPPATAAFTGCYYSNTTLSGNPALVRTDPQLNFNWANGSPDKSLQPFNFSARWQGIFTFSAGNYTFTATTSDGMRVYVDSNLIIDRWRDQSPNMYTRQQPMTAGSHLIVVEYYEETGGATAQLTWQNTSPPSVDAPTISSFAASPSRTAAGQPATLSWNVSGATSITIDNAVGDVTGRTSLTVFPVGTTTYTLTASNASGAVTAMATVTVIPSGDTQPPTAPTLTSATAVSSTEVDLVWTASTDNVGVIGYQILRDGAAIGSVPAASLAYADIANLTSSTHSYTVKAYDAALNYSAPSNALQVTAPAGPTISVKWYGGCWWPGTIYGVAGNFQAVDFQLTTSTPVPVQGTLFFTPNCDPSNGTDNMNDYNSLTPSTHTVQGFTYHPDEIPSSALFWVGPRTADGKCAPGSPCSGCLVYNKTTPSCDALP